MKKIIVGLLILVIANMCFFACEDGINVFSLQNDITLGDDLEASVKADPTTYPIMETSSDVHKYVEGILADILTSTELNHADDFVYRINVIDKNVVNAFAAPGGYICIYTGLLRYAESKAEVAGIIAHEVAHADLRHTTNTMTKEYGVGILLSMLTGDDDAEMQTLLATMASNGVGLAFSRDHENEADEHSLKYLDTADGDYQIDAIKQFFDRMLDEEEGSSLFPEITDLLSTHPYDGKRKANIEDLYEDAGSPAGQLYEDEHAAILKTL